MSWGKYLFAQRTCKQKLRSYNFSRLDPKRHDMGGDQALISPFADKRSKLHHSNKLQLLKFSQVVSFFRWNVTSGTPGYLLSTTLHSVAKCVSFLVVYFLLTTPSFVSLYFSYASVGHVRVRTSCLSSKMTSRIKYVIVKFRLFYFYIFVRSILFSFFHVYKSTFL